MGLDWVGEIFQKRGVEKMKQLKFDEAVFLQLEKVRYNVKHEEETEAAIKQVELEKELLKMTKKMQFEKILINGNHAKISSAWPLALESTKNFIHPGVFFTPGATSIKN